MADISTFSSVSIADISTLDTLAMSTIAYINGISIAVGGILGTLWVWGLNHEGQLGLSDLTTRSSPTQIGSEATWTHIAYGEQHTLAVREGKLFTWGDGGWGRTGHGNTTDYSSPVQVGTLTDWKMGECMDAGFAAVKTDGTLWTCGYNDVGQLGDGTIVAKSSPVQIGSATNWDVVVCSEDGWHAINTAGELWGAGSGFYGIIGDNASTHRSSPVQIGSLTTWVSIENGFRTAFGVNTSGELWAWGRNDYYQCGLPGSTAHKSSPVQVGTGTDWLKAVQAWNNEGTAPSRHGNGIKGGSLQGWGLNFSDGRMGDLFTYVSGTTYSSPVQLGATGTWTDIDNGTEHGLAIKSDSSLYTWGENHSGQQGSGDLADRSSPMQVGSETDWLMCTANDHMSAGIRSA